MLSTWIELGAKGRNGGPVRAGVWAAVVVGTHPIEADQEVWLEITIDDVSLGPLPAHWLENKGANSYWHVPIPPQGVNARITYQSAARLRCGGETFHSPRQMTVVRPNLPDRSESAEIVTSWPEGLVGNRMMTARIDSRGSTQDIYFPTVGFHSNVRPAEGDLPHSRANFRAIVGGLALRKRFDWFNERLTWEATQNYQGATNILNTELRWKQGPLKVRITDFAVYGDRLPKTAGMTESPGQYVKRFRISNEGDEVLEGMFGVFIKAEVNGGVGEPGLLWMDGDRALLAFNRGHAHSNRKLARDATVEFSIALDDRGPADLEPSGPNEAVLLRPIRIGGRETVSIDLLVTGAFTGWRGDPGTYQHWIQPALSWFRASNLDEVEQASCQEWDAFLDPAPTLHYPKPAFAVSLRRSTLAAALHTDAHWGGVASGYDLGLNAYCRPREAIATALAFERLGRPEITRKIFQWLASVRGHNRFFTYWAQKYTIDGYQEWETPAVDQTAMIPWGLEQYYRRTGDLDFLAANWPMIERAATACEGKSGHPGLKWVEELSLITSAGIWDNRFGAFLYSNTAVVAGLRAAARIARRLGRDEAAAARWDAVAGEIWERGILGGGRDESPNPGLVDSGRGRFLEARRLSMLRGLWTDEERFLVERSASLDVSLLGPTVPFGLIAATDSLMRRCAEELLKANASIEGATLLTRWKVDPSNPDHRLAPGDTHFQDVSSLATLWMVRYLIELGRRSAEVKPAQEAVRMLEGVISRLGPLGLILRAPGRGGPEQSRDAQGGGGVWGLHVMLIDTILDLAGVDYDVPEKTIRIEPVLAPAWPSIGLSRKTPLGTLDYGLERPLGGSVHRLRLKLALLEPTRVIFSIGCPGLSNLGAWPARDHATPPAFDPKSGRLRWELQAPAGETTQEWTWG